MHIHHYTTIRDTGKHLYQACRCGKRRVTNTERDGARGFQPWDRGWLATGEWTPMGVPSRSGTGVRRVTAAVVTGAIERETLE